MVAEQIGRKRSIPSYCMKTCIGSDAAATKRTENDNRSHNVAASPDDLPVILTASDHHGSIASRTTTFTDRPITPLRRLSERERAGGGHATAMLLLRRPASIHTSVDAAGRARLPLQPPAGRDRLRRGGVCEEQRTRYKSFIANLFMCVRRRNCGG